MKISIGGDHAGFPLKATVIAVCKDLGHEVTDHGCYDETPVDFPDITRQVCADVRERQGRARHPGVRHRRRRLDRRQQNPRHPRLDRA